MIKNLDLKKQYHLIEADIKESIFEVIETTSFIGGKFVSSFEDDFAKYCNSKYCIGVGNGTDAIEIALEAADLPTGSEVIVPGNSFVASSEAVTRTGHKVVFCDVDDTYTISIESLRKKISKNTKAIIAVHLYGHPCDMDAILALADEFGIIVIEDCAQAHGSSYKGKQVGTIGDFGTFSFYPGKNLGAYGDAGAITTQREEYATKVRMIANHGRISKYDHEFEGRNSRLDGIQAAILSVKVKYLNEWVARRVEIAELYKTELINIGDIVLPVKKECVYQAYHLFVIRTSKRDELKEHLSSCGIESGIHYPIALPNLKAYGYLPFDGEVLSAKYSENESQLLSLPIGEHLDDSEVHEVISRVKEFFNS